MLVISIYPGLLAFEVVGVLEYHGIMINKVVYILAGGNGKLVRNAFGFAAAEVITQADGMAAAVGAVDRETAVGIFAAPGIGGIHGMPVGDRPARRRKRNNILPVYIGHISCITGPVVKCAGFEIDVIGTSLCGSNGRRQEAE